MAGGILAPSPSQRTRSSGSDPTRGGCGGRSGLPPYCPNRRIKRLGGTAMANDLDRESGQGMYERSQGRNAANYVPLTPISLLRRTASVYPDSLAIVHGPRRQSWAETERRCRLLAGALAEAGIRP